MVKVGDRMKELRKRLGLTQKQFAAGIPGKIDYTYVGKIERNQQYPSLKLLEKIGDACSVPLSYFFDNKVFNLWNYRQDLQRIVNEHIKLTLDVLEKLKGVHKKISGEAQ